MAVEEACGGPRNTIEHATFGAGLGTAPDAEVAKPMGAQVTPLNFALRLQELRQQQHEPPQNRSPQVVYTTNSGEDGPPPRKVTRIIGSPPRHGLVTFTRTPEHDAIVRELVQIPACLPAIQSRLGYDPSQKEFDIVVGDVAEAHIGHAWQALAESAFKGVVEPSPQTTWQIGEYCFIRDGVGGITVYDERTATFHGEIDHLDFVRKRGQIIPTVTDVKAQSSRHNGQHVDLSLRYGSLTHAARIIGHVYHQKPAVMLVATEGSFNPQSSEIQRFQARGGYVATMRPPLGEFVGYTRSLRGSSQGNLPIPRQRVAVG